MIIHYDINNKMQTDGQRMEKQTQKKQTNFVHIQQYKQLHFSPFFFDRLKHMIVDIFMNIKLYQWKSKIMKYLRDIIDTIYNTAIQEQYDKPTTISTQILREDVMLIEPKINSTEQTIAEFTK